MDPAEWPRGDGLRSEHLADGRRFRVLTMVDRFSRRCPCALVDTSIRGGRLARFLDELAAIRGGYPVFITVDNDPELISNALDECASEPVRSRSNHGPSG